MKHNGNSILILDRAFAKGKHQLYAQKRHQCNICDKKYFSNAAKEIHMANVHFNRREFPCSKCDKRFNTRGDLNSHLKRHGKPPIVCDLCGEGFWLNRKLENHKSYVHDKIVHTCEVCKKVFTVKSNYEKHLQLWDHYANNIDKCLKLKCELCNKFFRNEDKLKEHVTVHVQLEEPRICFICGKTYKSLRRWRVHKNNHNRQIICDQCGKIFKQETNFTRHYRIHTGERPYHCNVCGKNFRQRTILKTHLRTHTGEKPYECSRCNKRFSSSGNLKQHLCKGQIDE